MHELFDELIEISFNTVSFMHATFYQHSCLFLSNLVFRFGSMPGNFWKNT